MIAVALGVCLIWIAGMVVWRAHPLVANRFHLLLGSVPLVALVAAAAARSSSTVSDRRQYLRFFRGLQTDPETTLDTFDYEPLFGHVLWALGRVFPTTEVVLFAGVSLILAVCLFVANGRLMPSWAVTPAFLTLVASGWFSAYTGVAVRQGLAFGVLLVAVSLALSGYRPRWVTGVLLVAAPLFHWTALYGSVVVVVVAAGLRLLTLRVAVAGWIVLALLFVTGTQRQILGPVAGAVPAIESYSSSAALENYGSGGNRLPFLLVSGAILGLVLLLRTLSDQDAVTDRLIVIYVLWNYLFLLLGFVAFSDRLAAYSWMLAPTLLWRLLGRARPHSHWPLIALVSVVLLGFVTGVWGRIAAL
ncbi:EpsG family protein [Parenemella sanctibonifatiensis]|uniref:EpsG family protein n=1 Tax=Parenemella sanctibonifatiensis TaxID=2016505 RepID=UPI0015C5EE0F|nr:EpsG family protein [Parenemella sanctibonifatiensis]